MIITHWGRRENEADQKVVAGIRVMRLLNDETNTVFRLWENIETGELVIARDNGQPVEFRVTDDGYLALGPVREPDPNDPLLNP